MAPVCAGLLFLVHVAASAISPISLRQTDTANNHVVPAILPVNNTNDHAYWYRRLFGLELSARQLECARNGTVLTEGAGEGEGAGAGCAWLLEQGPCAPSEWLVLEEGKGLRPACRPRPCAPGYALLAGERRCAPTHQLCAGGGDAPPALRYSLRGEARCHCKGFRALGPDARCHLLYARGACPEGQILMATYGGASLDSSRGTCLPSPCPGAEGALPLLADGGREIACSTDGDCSATFLALLDAAVGVDVPVCGDGNRGVIRPVARPFSCIRDNRGNCATPRMRSPAPFDWGVELQQPQPQPQGEDRIVFPERSAAAAAATDPSLRAFLSRYSLFALWGV